MKRRATVAHLTLMQHFALAADGWDPVSGDPFDSPEAAREAWELHRERLVARCEPGEMPLAFWWLEGPPELRAVDPAEPIDVAAWGGIDERPQAEHPAKSDADRLARYERYAREDRLAARRRAHLKRSRPELRPAPVPEAPTGPADGPSTPPPNRRRRSTCTAGPGLLARPGGRRTGGDGQSTSPELQETR